MLLYTSWDVYINGPTRGDQQRGALALLVADGVCQRLSEAPSFLSPSF